MPVAYESHRHCRVCGKVCALDSDTCSKACRAKREQLLQSRRALMYLLAASGALLTIVFVSRLFV